MATRSRKQTLQLLAGIDRQIADAEKLLLSSMSVEDARKIVDQLPKLKVARHNLRVALHADVKINSLHCLCASVATPPTDV